MPHLIRLSIIFLIGFTCASEILRADVFHKKMALEFIYNWNNTLIRIRPLDYLHPSDLTRVDLLLGRRFGDFSAYIYWKYNSQHEHFLGTRFDYQAKALENRLRAIFQVRGFVGLNKRSQEHFYLITQWDYQVDKAGIWRPGLMGYGVKEMRGDAVFFLGPAVTTKVTNSLSFRLSYGLDLLSSDSLFYLKCYIFL